MKRPDWLPHELLIQAGKRLGCTYAEVEAVTWVECPRDPFDERGNISNLYEPHIYFEQAQKRDISALDIAQQFPFVRHLIRETPFPKGGYGKYSEQITRFTLLAQLPFEQARDLAAESCSWGGWQVLGKWWKELGYASPDDFLLSMRTVEGQLEVFCRYVETFNLTQALRDHDWEGFALGYNGKNYKKFGYHWKLSEAYIAIVRRDSPRKPLAQSSTVKTATALGTSGLIVTPLVAQRSAPEPAQPLEPSEQSTPANTAIVAIPTTLHQPVLVSIIVGQTLTITLMTVFFIYHYLRKRSGHAI
jgi:hypothetical protein